MNSDGLNEADEMNLYAPNAQLDTPFGFGDLEWLYRQQDVDGELAGLSVSPARPDQLLQPGRRPAAVPTLRAR